MSDSKEFNYINVIPLVDVMLVLLTIVLTTSTFIATGGIPVELPRAAKSNVETLRTVQVEIARTGKIFVNAKAVSLADLRQTLRTRDRATPILIRADRNIKLQDFVDVLDTVKSLGFRAVSLQTETRP